MPVQRKVFRIERTACAPASHDLAAGDTAAQLLDEIKALHQQLSARSRPSLRRDEPGDELNRLRGETQAIHQALARTRQEIAALQTHAFGPPRARLARELDAVATGTETATQQILNASETIEDAARNLVASLKQEQGQALALDIQDSVLRIFEACNFHDLTGQRIAKVLATLAFVEARVAHMIDIWADIGELDATGVAAPVAASDPLLQGPKLEGEPGHLSQAEVDAMFAG